MPDINNGWETYTKLVLQQLETLSHGVEGLREELHDVKTQLTELKAKEDRIQDLKVWKDKMDDTASSSQLKSALKDIEDLKIYKTKAMTTFMVIQGIMATVLAWSKLG
jgi:hypothetical protein|tara:strand:- start:16402 stop:16725 length:324 start_codon:yes stop_codon:yes gene_type:complete